MKIAHCRLIATAHKSMSTIDTATPFALQRLPAKMNPQFFMLFRCLYARVQLLPNQGI